MKYKIPIKFKKRGRYAPNFQDKKYWKNLYDKGLTTSEICKLTGWKDRNTIANGLKDIGFKTRNPKERFSLIKEKFDNYFTNSSIRHLKNEIIFNINFKNFCLNEPLSYLIGAWFGDGRKKFRKGQVPYFRFKVCDKKFALAIKSIVEKSLKPNRKLKLYYFNRAKININHRPNWEVKFYNKEFMIHLTNLTKYGNVIPKEILTDNSLFYAFLAGLIDSDGSFFIPCRKYNKGTFRYAIRCETSISSINHKIKVQIKKKLNCGFVDDGHWRIYTKREAKKHLQLLKNIVPYLTLKKKQAQLLMKALNIWFKPRVKYVKNDFKQLLTLRNQISNLNKGGYKIFKKIIID